MTVAGVRLCAFGESTVNGTGDPDHLGWVGRAVAGRREVTLYNLGIRRETSEDLAARWRGEAELRRSDQEPLRLLFSFGCNDCMPDPARGIRVPPDAAEAAAGRILGEAVSLAPTLMVGPPPIADAEARERVRSLNRRLAAAAGRAEVPFIDVFAALEASPAWMTEILEWDGVHPGAAGYAAYAAAVVSDPAWGRFLP